MNQKLMMQPYYAAYVKLEAQLLPLLAFAIRELNDEHSVVREISSALSRTTQLRREFEARLGTDDIL